MGVFTERTGRRIFRAPSSRRLNMRSVIFSAVALALLSSTPAIGAPCREKGKFVKCAPVKKVAVKCRANGKFAKCGTPGAKPV